MSALRETHQCFPREVQLGDIVLPAGEPDHEHCPVGQHMPGVMGGWHCPCPCHNGAHNKRDELTGDALRHENDNRRVSYLSTAEFAKLNHACLLVSEAFGNFTTYLVGSATAKAAYRDVDVRTILDDEEFDAIFAGREFFWSLTCLGITTYLKEMTGLPVDFQIQRRTQANENYEAGTRNPIGKRARPFAGGGDATNFNDPPSSSAPKERE